jgi:hypothetical protein
MISEDANQLTARGPITMKLPVVADAAIYDMSVCSRNPLIYDHEETGVKELLPLSLVIS